LVLAPPCDPAAVAARFLAPGERAIAVELGIGMFFLPDADRLGQCSTSLHCRKGRDAARDLAVALMAGCAAREAALSFTSDLGAADLAPGLALLARHEKGEGATPA
ncbi:MAG: hypothetical protein K6A65_07770, partial [Succinivibrionaceae bacterium]|nr:hypothetical protein [Succinivibrionaceae bacterium]